MHGECPAFRRFLGTPNDYTYIGPFPAGTDFAPNHPSLTPGTRTFPLLTSTSLSATVEMHVRFFTAPLLSIQRTSKLCLFRAGELAGSRRDNILVSYIYDTDTLVVEHGLSVQANFAGFGLASHRGTWAHLAAVITAAGDSSSTTFEVYLNGVLVGTQNVPGVGPQGAEVDAYAVVGGWRTNYITYDPLTETTLRADIDDVRLWAGARSPAGIAAGVSGDLGGDESSLGLFPPSPCVVKRDVSHGDAVLILRLLFDECPQGAVRSGPTYDPIAGLSRGVDSCTGVPVFHRTSAVARLQRFTVRNTGTRDVLNAVADLTIRDAMLHVRDAVLDPECATLSFVMVDAEDPDCQAYMAAGAGAGAGGAAGVLDPAGCTLTRMSHVVDAHRGGCAWLRPATGPVVARVRVPFIKGLSEVTVLAVMGPTGFPNGYDVFNIAYSPYEDPADVLPDTEALNGSNDPALAVDPDTLKGYTGFTSLGIGAASAVPGHTQQRRNLAFGVGASMHWTAMVWDSNVVLAPGGMWYWGTEGHPVRSTHGGLATVIGVDETTSQTHYSTYFAGHGWTATPVNRSRGWHHFEYIAEAVESTGGRLVTMRIDGVTVYDKEPIGSGGDAEDGRLDSTIHVSSPSYTVLFDDFAAWVIPPPGTLAVATRCGDGVVDFEEQCDDGNLDPHDGCSPGCRVEDPWKCSHPQGSTGPSTCINAPPHCGRALTLAYDRSADPNGARCKVSRDRTTPGFWAWCFTDPLDPSPLPNTAWMRIARYPSRPVSVSGLRTGDPSAPVPADSDALVSLSDGEIDATAGERAGDTRVYRFSLADGTGVPIYVRSPSNLSADSMGDPGMGFIDAVESEVCANDTATLTSCVGGGFTAIFNASLAHGDAVPGEVHPDRFWMTYGYPGHTIVHTCSRLFTNHAVGSFSPNVACYTTGDSTKRCFAGGHLCFPKNDGLDGTLTPDVWVNGAGVGHGGATCTGTGANNRRFEATCHCDSYTCAGGTATTAAANAAGAGCGCGWDSCDAASCGDGYCHSAPSNYTSCSATPCDAGGVTCTGTNCHCLSLGPHGSIRGRLYSMRAVEISVLDVYTETCGDGIVQPWEECDALGGIEIEDLCSTSTCMTLGPNDPWLRRDNTGISSCKELAELIQAPYYGGGDAVRIFGGVHDAWPRSTRRIRGPLSLVSTHPRFAAICRFESFGGVLSAAAAFTYVGYFNTEPYTPTGGTIGSPRRGKNVGGNYKTSDLDIESANGMWRDGPGGMYVMVTEGEVLRPSVQTMRVYHRLDARINDTARSMGIAPIDSSSAQTSARAINYEAAIPLMKPVRIPTGVWWELLYILDDPLVNGTDFRFFSDHIGTFSPPTHYSCNWAGTAIPEQRCFSRYGTQWLQVPQLSMAVMEDECGDGIVSPREMCDDGNYNPHDGCTACRIDDPWYVCEGEPSVCYRGLSCAGVHAAHPTWPSATYRIGVNVTASPVDGRPVASRAIEVPCEMETDGGGWTRVMAYRGDDMPRMTEDGHPEWGVTRMVYALAARSAQLPDTVVNDVMGSATLTTSGSRPMLMRFNASMMLSTLYVKYDSAATGCMSTWNNTLLGMGINPGTALCPSRICRGRRLDRELCPARADDWRLVSAVPANRIDTYTMKLWDGIATTVTDDWDRIFTGVLRGCWNPNLADRRCFSGGYKASTPLAGSHSPHASAQVWFRPLVVGDGFVDTVLGEECDDGNMIAGDGCDADGRIETPTLMGAAPLRTCDDVAAAGGTSGVHTLRMTHANGTKDVPLSVYCDIPAAADVRPWMRPRALLALFSQPGALDSASTAVNASLSSDGLRGPGRPWMEGPPGTSLPLHSPSSHDPTASAVTALSHDWRPFLTSGGATLVQECTRHAGPAHHIAFAFDLAPGPPRSRARPPVDSLAQDAMGHPGMRLAAHTIPLASARVVGARGWVGADSTATSAAEAAAAVTATGQPSVFVQECAVTTCGDCATACSDCAAVCACGTGCGLCASACNCGTACGCPSACPLDAAAAASSSAELEWVPLSQGGLMGSGGFAGGNGTGWNDWAQALAGANVSSVASPARLWLPPTREYIDVASGDPLSGYVATGHAARGSIAFRKGTSADVGSAGVVAGGIGFAFLPSFAAGEDPLLRDPVNGVGGDPGAGGGARAATASPLPPAGSDIAHLPGRRDVYGLSGAAMTCAYWVYPADVASLPTSCADLAQGDRATLSRYVDRLRTRSGAIPTAGPIGRGGRPRSGTYLIAPGGASRSAVVVFCDMDTPSAPGEERGGWTLLSKFTRHAESGFSAGHLSAAQFAERRFDRSMHDLEWKYRRGSWQFGPTIDADAGGLQGSLASASLEPGQVESPHGRQASSDEASPLDPRYDDAGPSAGFAGRGLSSVDWRALFALADRNAVYRLRQRCEIIDEDDDPARATFVADVSFDAAWGDADRVRVVQHVSDPTVKGRDDRSTWKLASPVVHEWSLPTAAPSMQGLAHRERQAFYPAVGSSRGKLYSGVAAHTMTGCSAGRDFGVAACGLGSPASSVTGQAGIVGETGDLVDVGFSTLPRAAFKALARRFPETMVYPDQDSTMVCTYWTKKVQRVPHSCTEVLRRRGGSSSAAPTGLYWIESRDAPGREAKRTLRVFCDMDAYHGGFTLLASFATPAGGSLPHLPQAQYDAQFYRGGWIFGSHVGNPESDLPDYTTGVVDVRSYNLFSIMETFRTDPGKYEVRQQCYLGSDPTIPAAKKLDVSHVFTYPATVDTNYLSRLGFQADGTLAGTNGMSLQGFSVISNYGASFDVGDEGNAIWYLPFIHLSGSTTTTVYVPCASGGTETIGGGCSTYATRRYGGSGIITNPGTNNSDLGFGALPFTFSSNYGTSYLHQDAAVYGGNTADANMCSYFLRETPEQFDTSQVSVSTVYAPGGGAPLFIGGGTGGAAGLGYPGATTTVTVNSVPCAPLSRSDALEAACPVAAGFAAGSLVPVTITINPGPPPGLSFGTRPAAVVSLTAVAETVSFLPQNSTHSAVPCHLSLAPGAAGRCPTLRGWLAFDPGSLAGPPLPHAGRVVSALPVGPGPHPNVSFALAVLELCESYDGDGLCVSDVAPEQPSPSSPRCVACEGCAMCDGCSGCPLARLLSENGTLGVVAGVPGETWGGSGKGSLQVTLEDPLPATDWASRVGGASGLVTQTHSFDVTVDIDITFPKFSGASYANPSERVQFANVGATTETVTVTTARDLWPDPSIDTVAPAIFACAAGTRVWDPAGASITLAGSHWEPAASMGPSGSFDAMGLSNATAITVAGLACVTPIRGVGTALTVPGTGNGVACDGLDPALFPVGYAGSGPAGVVVAAVAGATGTPATATTPPRVIVPGRIDVNAVTPALGALGVPPGFQAAAAGGNVGTVMFNGTGFTGATGASLGSTSGAPVCATVRVISDTSLECNISLPFVAPFAASPVVVESPTRCMAPVSSGTATFGVLSPAVTQVTPTAVSVTAAGDPVVVTLIGSGFPFPASFVTGLNATLSIGGGGGDTVSCSPATLVSSTQLTCAFAAPATLNSTVTTKTASVLSVSIAMGASWTLVTAADIAVPAPAMTIALAPPGSVPTVVSVSPASGPATGGTMITVNGTNFAPLGSVSVTVGGAGGSGCAIVSVAPSLDSLVCTTGAHAGPYGVPLPITITVTTGGGASVIATTSPLPLFTYLAPATATVSPVPSPSPTPPPTGFSPVIESVWPRLVPTLGGIEITLTGSFISPSLQVPPPPSAIQVSSVTVGGIPCASPVLDTETSSTTAAADPSSPTTTATPNRITCTVPASPGGATGQADVVVVMSDGSSSPDPASVQVEYVVFSESLVWVAAEGADPALTHEDGTAATFDVSVRPGFDLPGEVVVTAVSSDETEGVVVPGSITLGPQNREARFTIVGVPDSLRDGNVSYTATVTTSSSIPALDATHLAQIRLVNLDRAPEVLAVRPTVVPMAGGVPVTVYGRHFDANVTVWAGPIRVPANATQLTVVSPAVASAATTRRNHRGALQTMQGSGSAATATAAELDFPAGSTHAVVYISPELDLRDYQDVSVRNEDTLSGTGTGAKLLFMSEDCPFPGQYGLGTTCRDCPTGGICPGGNRIWPMQGYWNPGENSGFVERCDPPEACIGCDAVEAVDDCYATTPPCSTGYEGEYCSECTRDPPHVRTRGRCVPCPAPESQLMSLIFFAVLWLVVSLCGALLEQRESFSHVAQVVIAVQEIYGVGSMVRFALPGWVAAIYDVLVLFSGDITFAKMDCTGAFDPNTDFFVAIAFNICIGLPMHLLVQIVKCIAVPRARSIGGEEAAEERRAHYAARSVRLLHAHAFLVYLAVTTRCLGILTCLKTGPEMRLAERRSHVCYQGIHVAATALASTLLVGFTIGFPATVLLKFMRGRTDETLYEDRAFYEAHDFMYEAFTKRDRYGWLAEFVVSVSIAIASTVLVDHPVIQLCLTGLVFALFALGIVARRPFIRGYENVVFFSLQISNVVAAVIVYLTNTGTIEGATLSAMIYLLVALAGGVLVTFVTVAVYAVFLGPGSEDAKGGSHGGKIGDLDYPGAEFEYEYGYEGEGEDGDHLNGGGGGGGGGGAFDIADPTTWLTVFGVGNDDDAQGDGGADNNINGRKRVRKGRVLAAAGVTAAGLAGRTEREGGPALPAEVERHVSKAVQERAYEPAGMLSPILAAVGLTPDPTGPPPVPAWWSKAGQSGSGGAARFTAATPSQLASLQHVLDATAIDFTGGVDNRGLTHTRIEAVSAQLVENPRLFAAYASEVAQVRAAHAGDARCAPRLSLATERADLLADIVTVLSAPDANTQKGSLGVEDLPLATEVNECVLLHGARSDVALVIASDGLDPRVGSTAGMFGVAAYLAENSSKADQYAVPEGDEGLCTLVLMRAVVGTPYVARDPVPFVKPPCRQAGHAGRACTHAKYDAVLGEIEANVPGAALKRHREICVYDRTKTYPWAIIRYKRV